MASEMEEEQRREKNINIVQRYSESRGERMEDEAIVANCRHNKY